ncbi:hypothetical protein OUZ56_009898 [Daphnia magna]|uniref:Uncharacterized protein n=1 Tax=Daphnia magna TaxID=35525 RepID=A0ABR0AHF4_9CRUS|nr:hypothetical protein OUZ56_009898 [Daphnia magna]
MLSSSVKNSTKTVLRSCGGWQDAATASTFLRIYRMLSIYVPVNNALRIDGNIDEEERMHILTSYKYCMLKGFKENVDKSKKMRENLKDALLKELIFAKNRETEQKDNLDLVQSNGTYYNCGCLIFTRKEEINCENCLDALTAEKSELPSEFYAAHITKLRSKGFLRFASLGFYYTIAKAERILQKHFKQSHQALIRDSFQLVIREVVGDGLSLPPICCGAHRHEQLSFLIYEYVVLRYHIEAKRFKNDALQ